MPFLLVFFRNKRRKRRLLQPSRSLRRALPATQKKSGDSSQNSEVRIQNKTEFEFKLNSVSWILTPEFLVLKLPHTFIHAFVRGTFTSLIECAYTSAEPQRGSMEIQSNTPIRPVRHSISAKAEDWRSQGGREDTDRNVCATLRTGLESHTSA